MTSEEVVETQLKRYNDHDLDAFCSCYSDDIELINLPESEPYLRSRDSLRELYGNKFANPALKARIVNRMVKNNFVIDHEKVSRSRRGGEGCHSNLRDKGRAHTESVLYQVEPRGFSRASSAR